MGRKASRSQSGDTSQVLRRPRISLQRSLIRWMMVLVIIPIVTWVTVFSYFVSGYIKDRHRHDGDLLVEVTAASLVGRLSNQATRRPGDLIDSLSRHPSVAFAAVTDPEGRMLYSGIFKPSDWNAFQSKALVGGILDIRKPRTVELENSLFVRTAQIIHGSGSASPVIEGGLVVGIRNAGMQRAIWALHVAQAASLVVMCLACIPIARWLMRKWTRPLRQLVKATKRLAEGHPPEPVVITTAFI